MNPYTGTPQPYRRKSGLPKGCLIAVGVVVGLFVLLAACGALLSATSKPTASIAPTQSGPTPTTAKTGKSPAKSTAKSAPPQQQPQVFKGDGDKIVRIKQGVRPWLATLSHNGTANFIVDALGPNGETTPGLVNEIGHYSGTVLLNGQDGSNTAALKIQADGHWTLRLTPLTDARVWKANALHGHGDDVVRLANPSSGLTTMHATHTGQANFIVDAYVDGGQNNLINEIGHYTGEVQIPGATFLITIHADGAWTLTRG
jgi:hypothetical protein